MRQTADGFEWLVVSTDEARQLFGSVELYQLHDDDSESLIETANQINDSIVIGIEKTSMHRQNNK